MSELWSRAALPAFLHVEVVACLSSRETACTTERFGAWTDPVLL